MTYMASRTHLLSLALLAMAAHSCVATSLNIVDDAGHGDWMTQHGDWMAQHGRVYKDEAEKQYRFKVFKENAEYIESVNSAGDRKYKFGVNKFADMTKEEFKAGYTGFKPRSSRGVKATTTQSFRHANFSKVLLTLDWRKKGAVVPIKDQGGCGCCWAFSSVAATEGLIKLKTGKLISLSEQELVDCDPKNYGCSGGLMDNAFDFIKTKGLATEQKYPYKDAEGKCMKMPSASFKIKGHEDVPVNSESSLMKAVANQPVSVGVDSDGLQFYDNGVFTGPCGTEMDHAVTAVGYGTESDGTKYWLVKNSWGTDWGMKGYAKLKRDIEADEGLCGIAMEASYPIA